MFKIDISYFKNKFLFDCNNFYSMTMTHLSELNCKNDSERC